MKLIQLRLFTVLYIICIVSFSLFFTFNKWLALGFHEVDFPFYMQFTAKLFDPDIPARYSLNPEGGNWMGFSGVEGVKNIHQSLHLEPVKYLFATIYWIFNHPMAVFMAIALVYVLPVIYLHIIYQIRNSQDVYFLMLFTVLYLGFPAVVHTIALDLRPRVFLVPVFSLMFMAVHFRRPTWEKVLFFGLSFLIREEALILGALVIVYDLLRSDDKKGSHNSTFIFLSLWFAWLVVNYLYFHWTDYKIDPQESPISPLVEQPWLWFGSGLFFVLLVGVAAYRWNLLRPGIHHLKFIQLAWYCLIFIFLSWPLIGWRSGQDLGLSEVVTSIYQELTTQAMYFTALVILLLLIYSEIQPNRIRNGFLIALSGIAVLSLIFSVVNLEGHLVNYLNLAKSTRMVFDFKENANRKDTNILSDYSTIQAFYDFDRVFAFERLPWYIMKGNDRYYPRNQSMLARIIANRIDYIVIAKKNEDTIKELLELSGQKVINIIRNEDFIIMQLR